MVFLGGVGKKEVKRTNGLRFSSSSLVLIRGKRREVSGKKRKPSWLTWLCRMEEWEEWDWRVINHLTVRGVGPSSLVVRRCFSAWCASHFCSCRVVALVLLDEMPLRGFAGSCFIKYAYFPRQVNRAIFRQCREVLIVPTRRMSLFPLISYLSLQITKRAKNLLFLWRPEVLILQLICTYASSVSLNPFLSTEGELIGMFIQQLLLSGPWYLPYFSILLQYTSALGVELARDALTSDGFNVIGGYMSPVNDAYKKKALIPSEHRIPLCQLACLSSDFIMVDSWEASQSSFQRTVTVLSSIKARLCHDGALSSESLKVVLVCGSDLLQSFSIPGVWICEQVEMICRDFGIVCIRREGQDIEKVISADDILNKHQDNIRVVEEIVPNQISSTRVRECISRRLSIKYLTPDEVIQYITQHGLYLKTDD